MKPLFIFTLACCLGFFTSYAQVVTSPSSGHIICSDLSEKAISDKLDSLDTLALSDNDLKFSLQGSPLLSFIKYQYIQMSRSHVEKKGALFVLHTTMVPMPRVVSYPGASSRLLPHFSLLCKKSNSPKVKLVCKQKPELPHFIMENFKLSLEVTPSSSQCSGKNEVKLVFRADMDAAQYKKLQEYIKSSPKIRQLPNTILNNIDAIFTPKHLYNSYLFALYESFFN